MEDDDELEHGTFSILVPFTCAQSVGGPFDDRSLIAGYQLGALDAKLADDRVINLEATVYEELEHQCDLLSMHHGVDMEVIARHGSFIFLKFTKPVYEEQIPTL